MNKSIILAILSACGAFAQSQTPLTILQSAGSATGELRMQERRTNGRNYTGIKAPQSLAADIVYEMPAAFPTSSGQCLTSTSAGVWSWASCGATEVIVSDYDWSSAVGTVSAGTLTVTFTSDCPADGSDTTYKFLVTGTAPSTEVVTSDGSGTCTVGSSGTIKGTLAGGHTSATAGSASDGWQEAFYSVTNSGGVVRVRAAVGTYNVYSDILTGGRYVTAVCDGPGAVLVPKNNDVKVFHSNGDGGIRVSGCAINNSDSKTGTTGIYTYNASGNSTGAFVHDVNLVGLETCVHLDTVNAITGFSNNRLTDCTNAALRIEQVEAGDAGIGLIGPGNVFGDSVDAPYGILWYGPGNLKVQGNSFNGYVEQIHLEPKMGVVNVSGTAVTWVSGHKFRASMAGGGFLASSTVAASIATVTDDQNIVLASSQPTCTGCSYYVNNTSQMQIIGNTLDAWTATTHTIRAVGGIPFYNFQIQNNFFSNPSITSHIGVSIEGEGFYFGNISGNNMQTSVVGTTKAISITAGSQIDVHDNQIVNQKTGVAVGSSAVTVTVDGNRCTNTTNTTDCLTSASATALAREINSVTYTQLSAFTLANGSSVYCSNCQQTSATSATCATGGTGAFASRINGAWKCNTGEDTELWTASGSDVYRSAGKVGIGGIPATALDIMGGSAENQIRVRNHSATTDLRLQAFDGYSVIGTNNSTPLVFMTNTTERARFNATGGFDITGNASLTGTFTLPSGAGITGQSGSGSTFQNGSSFTVATGATLILDADVSSDLHPATDDLYRLGEATSPKRWKDIQAYGLTVIGTGAITTVTATTVQPPTNNAGTLGLSGTRFATLYTYDADFADDVTVSGTLTLPTGAVNGYVLTSDASGNAAWAAGGSSSLPVVDTTAIVKGSADATKLLAFEVDGFTTATTRTLTPQNASYTIAGTNIAQTFTSAQTYNSSVVLASGAGITGQSGSGSTFQSGSSLTLNSGSTFSVNSGVSSNLHPATDGAYAMGEASTPRRWNDIQSYGLTVIGTGSLTTVTATTIQPPSNNAGTVGLSGTRFASYYGYDGDFADDVAVGDALTVTGLTTATGGISTGSSSNSTIYVGSGNFYLRSFSGADASCGGVTNGWAGIRTDTNELQVCIGGALKKVGLT